METDDPASKAADADDFEEGVKTEELAERIDALISATKSVSVSTHQIYYVVIEFSQTKSTKVSSKASRENTRSIGKGRKSSRGTARYDR
jgi:hypothetical protein